MKGAGSGLNVAIVLNGISFYKKILYKNFLPKLQAEHRVQIFETKTKHDAISLASRCTESYQFDVILAAGGDGTLHQVVNGVVTGRETEVKLPVIGVIPMGSGNDFTKSARLTKDPAQLLALLKAFTPKPIDLGVIKYIDFNRQAANRYFINVADIGMGPEVVKCVNESGRAYGAAVAYYKAILTTFFTYKLVDVSVSADTWKWSGPLRSLAVGNGRYYGHGLCVAPDANMDDNIFDVFICGNVSVFDFIRYSSDLKKGKRLSLSEIQYKRTTSLTLSSEENCLIEGDGEILGTLPASIHLATTKIHFLM
jgi:diacylglycerol kinase (ATP)